MSSTNEKKCFKSIIVSPVVLPDDKQWGLKQEFDDLFKKYDSKSHSYFNSESSFYGYEDNFAIVDFKNEKCAEKTLKIIDNGEIRFNEITITAKPIEITHSPVNKLPDDCLLEIFDYLSTYELLILPKVCKRWAKVCQYLWNTGKTLHFGSRSIVDTCRNCLPSSGPYIKDIYLCDFGLRLVEKNCKNIENISLEIRRYNQSGKKRGRPCVQDERELLQKFTNLTRLLLKIRITDTTYFSFLEGLPSTIIEIHLFNDIKEIDFVKYRLGGYERERELGQFNEERKQYGKKTFKLSKFTELQALTLKCYYLCNESLNCLGELKKLTCLRLDNCRLPQRCANKLKIMTNLEHLSLKNISMNYEDMTLILKKNHNLKYLALPHMNEGKFDNDIWLQALKLQQLKVICWTNIEHEIKNCGASTSIEYMDLDNVNLSNLIPNNFPNLKSLRRRGACASDTFDTSLYRAGFKYYFERLPKRKAYRCSMPDDTYIAFRKSHIVSAKDAKIFRCNGWDGWYIKDTSPLLDTLEEMDKEPMDSTITFSSTIDDLSDICLNRIFNHLPLDDKLTAAEICKRWERVLWENWENCKRFDVRELSNHEKREKCMVQCGKYFEDIYSYKSCGFSGIETHCSNVKSLAVDFGVKKCVCRPSPSEEWYSLSSLQPTLMRLKHLTRIMLRDAPIFQSDIFKYLPEILEEIHVINKCPRSSEELTESQLEDNAIILDLSRYSKLRALTLIDVGVTQKVPSGTPARVIGLENLEELIYLRLSGVIIVEDSGNPLKNIKKLEYLSLPLSTLSANNFGSLIENNRNIEYLDITDNFDGVPISKFLPIFTLQRLRCLRIFNTSKTTPSVEDSEHLQEIPVDFDITDGMPHLEIVDCGGLCKLPQNLLLQLIGASPILKMFNISVTDVNFGEKLLTVAETNVMARGGQNHNIKVFLGIDGFRLCSDLKLNTNNVKRIKLPPKSYQTLAVKSLWRGWSTEDGRGNTSQLCSQLLNCINTLIWRKKNKKRKF